MEMNYEATIQEKENKGSVARGLVGAVIAAIVAAVLWAVIGVVTDSVFVLAGLGVGLLVCWGYDLLKGRQGVIRSVIVALCVILAVIAGDVGYYAWNINSWWQDEMAILELSDQELAEYVFEGDAAGLAEFNAAPAITKKLWAQNVRNQMEGVTFEEYVKFYIEDPEFTGAVAKDCGMSIFFGLLGSFGLILGSKKKKKEAAQVDFDQARVGDAEAVAAEDFAPINTTEKENN